MSITPYLDEFDADPETERVLAVTLEMTRVSLGLTDDLADGIIAKQIVELARAGERHCFVRSRIEDFTRAFVRRLTGGHRSASAPPLCGKSHALVLPCYREFQCEANRTWLHFKAR